MDRFFKIRSASISVVMTHTHNSLTVKFFLRTQPRVVAFSFMEKYTVFLPGATHTDACLIRQELATTSDTSVCSCVVADSMCEEEGMHVRCESKEELLRAIDVALTRVREWKSARPTSYVRTQS